MKGKRSLPLPWGERELAGWIGKVLQFLGLKVGPFVLSLSKHQRQLLPSLIDVSVAPPSTSSG
jgi:hypothetical protein